MNHPIENKKIIKPFIEFIEKENKFYINNSSVIFRGKYDDKKSMLFIKRTLIDSQGQVLNIIDFNYLEINLLKSLLYGQKVYAVEPIIEGEIGYMSLEELKDKIINHIKIHPKQGWKGVDVSTKVIIEKIKNFDNYKDLIMYFKYFEIS